MTLKSLYIYSHTHANPMSIIYFDNEKDIKIFNKTAIINFFVVRCSEYLMRTSLFQPFPYVKWTFIELLIHYMQTICKVIFYKFPGGNMSPRLNVRRPYMSLRFISEFKMMKKNRVVEHI